ncbi:KRI1-like family C-terminal-domain-containing protein [Glomus cerebriforme]|uniref:KRI1-like family C-terminal-domain-containing protein n=1 Tax=Glomus cerebriforme TaxID=658196 RepID=A0A397TKK3_9GLOM|nr:KRI1-like family C-terminal-domain-containing protein [Glomus cerebriforme]
MDSEEDSIKLTINSEFAKKYEERKRGEELSKLKEKYGDIANLDFDENDELSTSEEEDEFGELVTPELDAQIMKTIVAIKSKDPKVYDSQSNFFAEEEIQKAREQWLGKQREKKSEIKPMRLKDYNRKILLENSGIIDDVDNSKVKNKDTVLTPIQEEQKLKEEFKAAASQFDFPDNDDDDNFLVQRQKTAEELKAEEEDYQKFLLESMADTNDAETLKQWQNYKNNPNVDEDEAFLMDFILNRGWIDKDSDKILSYEELIAEHHDEEDGKFEEAVDQFESKYNFRFEEEGSTKVITYARNLEGLMRRTDNKRKLQRQVRSERKEEEKKRKMEELKRLKNLKKKEIFEKLRKIKEITGNDTVGFDDVDLEEDFDPNKYDEKMHKVFDDNYYAREADNEKPEWNDDVDIGDIVDSNSSDQNINSIINIVKEYNNYGDYNQEPDGVIDDFIMDADYLPGGEKYDETKFKKKKSDKRRDEIEEKKKVKRKFDEYLDEYYQLDYEDIIDDTPVRFKYRQTKSVSFGLTPTEILLADEKDLNEFVSLKKLAPYRPEHVVENDLKKYSKKKRLKQFRKKLELLEEQNPPEHNSWSIKSIKRRINEQEGKQSVGNIQNKNKKVKVHNEKEK